MEAFLAQFPQDGSEIEYSELIARVRAAGVRAELWREAKKRGLITARINEAGEHVLALVITSA